MKILNLEIILAMRKVGLQHVFNNSDIFVICIVANDYCSS